jgi:peptidoglycan/LPS O-acetylase OafA/YrhL
MGFLNALAINGGLGVYIFFVISGCLITSMSLRRYEGFGKIPLGEFLAFRIYRILPPLLLLVTANLLFYFSGKSGFDIPATISVPRLLLYVFTFRFNLFYVNGGAALGTWAVLWSLAIEEIFYLAFPIISRIVRLKILMCLLFFCVFAQGPFYRLGHGWTALYLYRGCFDSLALGCLVATFAQQRLGQKAWRPRLFRLVGLAVIFIFYFAFDIHKNQNMWAWLPTAISLGTAIFLLGSLPVFPSQTDKIENTKIPLPVWIVCLLGCLSYEIFLFHIPLMLLLQSPLSHLRILAHGWLPADLAFAVVTAFIALVCGLLHLYFSKPILHYARHATEKPVKPKLLPI